MKLFEFMAKDIFRQKGIPVPTGQVARTPGEVEALVSQIGNVAIKSQVLAGGRGKAGGIKFTTNSSEGRAMAEELFASSIKGYPIEYLLVEEKLTIDKELYLAITVDGGAKRAVVLASAHGGVDIEEVPEEHLVKEYIDPQIGIMPYKAREIAYKMGLESGYAKQVAAILEKLYKVFKSYDAELAEINPLVISGDKVIAADGKITIDDEAGFRAPANLPQVEERSEREKKAHDIGISYVELEGDIAVMANGAGITMATLDAIQYYGGAARNFMDAGGGASMEATAKALEILISTEPKAILANIFAGITRCDDVANAFKQVKETMGIPVPVVIRLVGTNEEKGIEILKSIGIDAYKTMDEAAQKVVELAKAQ